MDKDKLFTWKEIADYLVCNPRTCRRWEKKYGLPIKRIDDSSSLRVFAEKNEIDEWVEKRSSKRNKSKLEFIKRLIRKKVFYLLLLTIIASFTCLLILIAPSNIITANLPQPHDFKIENNKLIILDKNTKSIWKYDTKLKNLVDENAYREHFQAKRNPKNAAFKRYFPHLIIEDINLDNRNEVLFSIQTSDDFGEGKFLGFDNEGNTLLEFDAGRETQFGKNLFSKDYRIKGFDLIDINGDGLQEIILISHHVDHFPTQLIILDLKGRTLGEYWNSGYLSDYDFIDLDMDGKKEIIVGGTNNEYRKGCLIVFEPNSLRGSSPQNNNEFKCLEFKPGSEKYYILLPKTDVDLVEDSCESVREINQLKNSRISVWTTDSNIEFEFNYSLEVKDIRKSHKFEKKHRKYFAEGKINSKLNDEYLQNLKDKLLYWEGQNWVSTPTMTSYWKNKAINH